MEKNTHGKNVNEHTGMNDEISYTDIAFWLLVLAPLASEERDRFYRPWSKNGSQPLLLIGGETTVSFSSSITRKTFLVHNLHPMAAECCRTRLYVISNNVRLSLRTRTTTCWGPSPTAVGWCIPVGGSVGLSLQLSQFIVLTPGSIETCMFVHNNLLLRHESVVWIYLCNGKLWRSNINASAFDENTTIGDTCEIWW